MHGHRRLRGSEESRRHRKTSRHHENGSLLGLFGEEREEEEKEEKEEEERARGQHRYDKYGTQDARWPLRMYEKQLDEFQKRINSFSVSAPMVNVSLRVSPFSPLPFLLSLSLLPYFFPSFFSSFFFSSKVNCKAIARPFNWDTSLARFGQEASSSIHSRTRTRFEGVATLIRSLVPRALKRVTIIPIVRSS